MHQDKLVEGKEDPDIWVRRQHESTALGRGGVLEKYTRYKYQRSIQGASVKEVCKVRHTIISFYFTFAVTHIQGEQIEWFSQSFSDIFSF